MPLRVELFRLACLAPLFQTDRRAQSCGFVIASDASDDKGAFVSTQVPHAFAKELTRHVQTKGLWTNLLSPADALLKRHGCLPADAELPGEPYRTNALWTQLARALRFRFGAVFRRTRGEHINIKELESYLAVEEALGPNVWESSHHCLA